MRLNSTTSRPQRPAYEIARRTVRSFVTWPLQPGATRFAKAVKRYGLINCSAFQDAFLIGVRSDQGMCRELPAIPAYPRTIGFMDGPRQMGLINEFLHSPEAKRVQHLQIGVTPKLDQSVGYDLSRLLALFEGKRLPSLKSLSLGDCFLFGCPERDSVFCKGYLGEITPIFTAAPRLEMLDLNGTFCLPAPVQHSKLREVAIEVEMVEAGDDCLTQWSMANLLRSQFARVEALSLVCLGKVQALLDLPADFNPSEGMPRLHQLHMDNLNRESAQRQAALQAFLLAR